MAGRGRQMTEPTKHNWQYRPYFEAYECLDCDIVFSKALLLIAMGEEENYLDCLDRLALELIEEGEEVLCLKEKEN